MPEGVEVEIADGRARISFPDPARRLPTVARLIELGGPKAVQVDTGGTRRSYLVTEDLAVEAGLVDKPKRRRSSGQRGHGGGTDAVSKSEPDAG